MKTKSKKKSETKQAKRSRETKEGRGLARSLKAAGKVDSAADVGSFLFGSAAQQYDPNSQQAQSQRNFSSNAQDPSLNTTAATSQAAQLNTGNYDQDRSQQQGLASQLGAAANGQGPSAAVMAGQQSRDAALTQASALNAGRRGANAGAGALAGAQASSQGIQAANQTQAQGQANEMATARGQQAGVLGQLSSQDVGVAGQNAGFTQQTNLANAQNQQATNLANQSTQYNSMAQEQNAQNQQAQESFSNLQPASQGFLQGATQAAIGGLAKALAHGGVVGHSDDDSRSEVKPAQRVLVGEAGPEVIVRPEQVVDRPTVMDLGHDGPAAVIPLSPQRQHDRDRVTGIALGLRSGVTPPATDRAADGGTYALPQQSAPVGGNLGIGQRTNPNWNANNWGAVLGQGVGDVVGKLADKGVNTLKAKLMDSGDETDPDKVKAKAQTDAAVTIAKLQGQQAAYKAAGLPYPGATATAAPPIVQPPVQEQQQQQVPAVPAPAPQAHGDVFSLLRDCGKRSR